jgi:hypothetical protein
MLRERMRTNTNPYKGVSYHGVSKKNPWRAQINRRGFKGWKKNYPTPEAARDAYQAKMKDLGLNPLNPLCEERSAVDAVTQDKINEMDKLLAFEDRFPVGRIAKARDKVVRKKCGRNLK